jgi:tetratricopeptide (TPR) repeat protein
VSLAEQALLKAGLQPHAAVAAGVGIGALTYYWLGRCDEAAASARQSIAISREIGDTQYITYSLPHLGLALAGKALYTEAEQAFDEARLVLREYEVWPMLARATVMSAGFHLDIFDYGGQESILDEARELARSVNFLPPLVSSSLDLLFNFIARGEIGRAEDIVDEVGETVEKSAGTHGWLWRLRMAQAKAELVLARGKWEEALRLANVSLSHSQHRGRVKYQMFGLGTRATALAVLGRKREAIVEARRGVDLIRPVQAPALFVRAAAGLLALEGEDSVLAEARDAVHNVAAALTSETIRRSFLAAEPVQLILKF